jgi:serine/threonine protein kinase
MSGLKHKNLQLTDFELKDTLGTGSFGRVRLVKFHGDGGCYALKILKKSEVIYLKQVEHVKTEKKILEEIHHPFIVNLWGAFQDEKNLYLMMEYIIGGEFFSHLRKAGRFANDTAKFYAAEIALVFDYLHGLLVLYRDLKPENLLLDRLGHCKVTDFGFAKKVEYRTWTLCGTPEYLAPEIILSKGHGKAVDWWALGILMYEMLAGYPPFYDEDPLGIYQKILEGKIKFPWHFDRHSKDLIKKLLTADLTKRLGNLKGGAEDIKKHKWFSGGTDAIDWNALNNNPNSLTPPIAPEFESDKDGDTSNFEKYPDSAEGSTQAIDPRDQSLFADF